MKYVELSHRLPLAPRGTQISSLSSRVVAIRSALALFGCPGSLPVAVGRILGVAILGAVFLFKGGRDALSPSTYGEREETSTAFKPCWSRVRGGNLLGLASAKDRA
jgi:hypothetical protein